ncbi:sigma-70 family RNA polymerase sigma factor [Paludisphaera rhizosphaerae]|uniref:sigma-70 family RNA polymerase sigma factor n=1 Tax=Paludisphaera rhizosphaerae TaxID=2711216 RepID=UPI0013EADCCD|nr:sigma-70 family RNA polymerase sigma factor [Paludisphaera rhizosphaerae]
MARQAGASVNGDLDRWTVEAGQPDGLLLQAFLTRDEDAAEEAFRRLVDRHAAAVIRVCRDVLGDEHEAQDAAQAVFLVLARKAATIGRPDSLGSWLHGVALRVARRARDGSERRRRAEAKGGAATAERASGVAAIDPDDLQILHEELDRLPDGYRLPLVLCYFEGYTQERAAGVLGWPYGTLQARLHRGRRKLREALVRRDPALRGAMAALVGFRPDPAEWTTRTARAAVRFSGTGAQELVGPNVAQLALASAGSTTPALASAAGLLALGIALGAVWFAGFRQPANDLPTTQSEAPILPSPLVGEGAPEGRMRGVVTVAKPGDPPHPAFGHLLPPGEKGGSSRPSLDLTSAPNTSSPVPPPPAGLAASVAPTPEPRRAIDGRELFQRIWAANDARSHGGDGLGPVFNARSCLDCHDQGGVGGSGSAIHNIDVATVGPAGIGGGEFFYAFSMNFGGQGFEYRFGYDPSQWASADGTRRTDASAASAVHPGFRDSRSVVLHRFGVDPTYAAWRDAVPGLHGNVDVRVSQRNPSPLFGLGLIDAIPDEAIIAHARRGGGRVARVEGGRVGRFGWKAQTATLEEFVVSAASSELGLETPGRRQADSPHRPGLTSPGMDMDREECAALAAFVRDLPAPVASTPADPKDAADVDEGARTFRSIGCAGCHLPKLGDVEGLYSDLLLHDMGADLADAAGYTVFGAGSTADPEDRAASKRREWRTPPLWGLHDSAPYLHDGRAETVARAIVLHGGQGSASADRFTRLSPRRKRQVEAFLDSLTAPRGRVE